jgi:hypothetical protein
MRQTLYWLLAFAEVDYCEAYWDYCNASDVFWLTIRNLKDD